MQQQPKTPSVIDGWTYVGPARSCDSRRDEEKEQERQTLVPSAPSAPTLRAHPALSRGLKATKPIRAFLSYYSGSSGSAATAFATAFAISPNQDSSWSSWQAVFDEFRVVAAEFLWNVYFTTVPSAYPTNSPNAVVVYDPTSSVSLASVNAAMQFEKFSLLRIMLPAANSPLASPMSVDKDGYMKFRIKVPAGPVLSNSVTTNSTGMWRNTADAVAYDWGSFITYCASGGTSSVLRMEGFVRMEVEFRTRR